MTKTKLKTVREQMGLSIREAARQMGISHTSLRDHENGLIKRPNDERLAKIKAVYGRRISLASVKASAIQNNQDKKS